MGYRRQPKIVGGVELWVCTRCGSWFTKDNFYKAPRRSVGIKSECKKCHVKTSVESRNKANHRKYQREWMKDSGYSKRPEVRERERMRSKRRSRSLATKCRDILNDAIQHGIIQRPSLCPICGKQGDVEAHHDSYYRPLEVKWMCPLCHAEYHRNMNMGKGI